MLERLFERITGQPWKTVRVASQEFGPPPGARFAEELSHYSDAELVAYGDRIVADLAEGRRITLAK